MWENGSGTQATHSFSFSKCTRYRLAALEVYFSLLFEFEPFQPALAKNAAALALPPATIFRMLSDVHLSKVVDLQTDAKQNVRKG